MPEVKQQTVLITGCSTGIGHALVLAFHYTGYKVWATARDIHSLADFAEKNISTAALDVTCPNSRSAVISKILEGGDRIDVLINNAGYGAMGPMIESPESSLRQQFETNTFAPIALIQEVAPTMITQKSGTIVNITSVSGILTTPFSGMYCASKAAFSTLTEALRMELQPFGIHVLDVQPGAIRSSFGDTATKKLNIISNNSLYKPIEKAILARAGASQDNPSSAEGMADAIVKAIKSGQNPRVLRYGNGSRSLPFFARWLPRKFVHKVLARKFELNRL
ncbi:SDR family oxidoreductase [Sansalvadorimonas verongulae]|uniref:SDR family oxidoreductase n=1 Tax=Sansalvadorimonas verongulae TaxID=2172824 RepID=UPI0012BD6A6A|nr:SDR family oxidoreductase [Sansalvadorimonas verongulae]MTI13569.1 SDR family oxidoreductase [Sansalvadorimonas verongulae]